MNLFPSDVIGASQALLASMRALGAKLVTAESCTGGLIAAALTEIAGSSDVFERGFITYSNLAKAEALGVDKQLLMAAGAVSAETACAMAEGAITRSRATFAIAVTGIAGPDGGTPAKPVGLVYLATARRGERATATEKRFGDLGRTEIRIATVREAFALLQGLVGKSG